MNVPARPRRLSWLVALVVLGAFALLVWWVAKLMQGGPSVQKREPPRITQVILPPPPPPPPPPPKEPPEPKEPELVDTTPLQEIAPTPETPAPPGDPLTADAGPGNDAFGLPGGEGGGTRIGGKGGGGSPFAGYAATVQRAVQQFLQRDKDTRKGRYSAVVAVWLRADGSIERSQIVTSAGKPELDAAIVRALQDQTIPQAPPADLPQPINLRIGASAAG
ncbi:TonB family protein [Luteimonas aquatica]|uniref:TonB family protein n=1 Tax=Luteimonas aquatica TaxID=450364 RepID=UPI001F5745B0|nr:TonB family protein [Luteimonas aquatica]